MFSKYLKIKSFGIFGFALGMLALAGCSQKGGAPELLGADATPISSNSPAATTNNAESFQPKVSVQKLIYHVGPVNLLAGEDAEEMAEKPVKLNFQVSEPVWVIAFEPKILDANGRELPGRLLHKAILSNKHDENPVCASSAAGNPFAVATSTLTKVELPEGFGYPLLPEDPLEAKVVFQNKTGQDYVDVTFAFELTTIPIDKTVGYHDLKTILIDTDPCEYKPISLEPGKFLPKTETVTVAKGGNLVVANGVLSDYGVSVALTHQAGGQITLVPFWRAEAEFDAEHQIINLSPNPFIDIAGKKIANGDKLTLDVVFDNYSDEWKNAATGAAMIYLAPAP